MLSKLLSKEVFIHQSLINGDLPQKAVAYCWSGVFETDENKIFQLAYVNITTASGVDGRQVVSAQGNTNYFYLKDLLGSTRAVINQNGQGNLTIAEAIMYHSYGSMQYIQVASAETREKFTGKELDQEGEKYCEARLSITFNVFFRSANPVDPSPSGSVTVSYTDGSSETMSLSLLWTCFKLEQSFKYYSDKTISNISYALYNYVTSPAETNLRNLSGSVNITQNIAIGQQLHITGTATRTDMEANPNAASYYSFDNTTLRINGMELCYFGKRYFDPETGVFTTGDPKEQFWNLYSYCGGDPVNNTDPDGSWIGFAIGATIGGVAGLIGGYEATGNWGKAFGISCLTSLIGGVVGNTIEEIFKLNPLANNTGINTPVSNTTTSTAKNVIKPVGQVSMTKAMAQKLVDQNEYMDIFKFLSKYRNFGINKPPYQATNFVTFPKLNLGPPLPSDPIATEYAVKRYDPKNPELTQSEMDNRAIWQKEKKLVGITNRISEPQSGKAGLIKKTFELILNTIEDLFDK